MLKQGQGTQPQARPGTRCMRTLQPEPASPPSRWVAGTTQRGGLRRTCMSCSDLPCSGECSSMTCEMLKQGAMAGGESVSMGAPCHPHGATLSSELLPTQKGSMQRAPRRLQHHQRAVRTRASKDRHHARCGVCTPHNSSTT